MTEAAEVERNRSLSMAAERAKERVDRALASLFEASDGANDGGIKNAVVRVEAPRLGWAHATALGGADSLTGERMTPEHQFHLASVTKTMTAALILQMWEEGLLGVDGLDITLDDLEVFDRVTLERLHRKDGVSYGSEITVRELLTHTSGMKDGAVDDAGGIAADYGRATPGSYVGRLLAALDRHLACLEDEGCDVSTLITSKG